MNGFFFLQTLPPPSLTTTIFIPPPSNSFTYEPCQRFEFHILLIQLALLTVSSFMHLYFLLKALIMIIIVAIYVFYSNYLDIYKTIADKNGLTSSSLMIQTTSEVLFFILLLIGLDRRVRYRLFIFQRRSID